MNEIMEEIRPTEKELLLLRLRSFFRPCKWPAGNEQEASRRGPHRGGAAYYSPDPFEIGRSSGGVYKGNTPVPLQLSGSTKTMAYA